MKETGEEKQTVVTDTNVEEGLMKKQGGTDDTSPGKK